MNKSSRNATPDLNQAHYLISLHRAISYIDHHLNEPIKLETVAKVAAFSPFHFHRLFKSAINESLNAYILRKRIERAASSLMRHQEKTILDISVESGFNSHASFTRAFKRHFSCTPSEFKTLSPSRYAQINSKKGKTNPIFERYVCHIEKLKNWIYMNGLVEIKEMEEQTFACLDHMGEQGLEDTFGRLMDWAGKKELLVDAPQLALIYHDSYKVTSPDKVRMSVSIKIEPDFKPDEGLGTIIIPKGKHIVGRFEMPASEFKTAWSSMFVYMNEHNHQRREVAPFELYRNNFNEHPDKKFIIDLCIPIK